MASASARPKGLPPPGGGSFPTTVRCSCSDRRPTISTAASLRWPHQLPALSIWRAALQELLPPTRQRRGRHAQLARKHFEVFPAQQPNDRCKLAFGRPAAPAIAPHFGSLSGRPAGSL